MSQTPLIGFNLTVDWLSTGRDFFKPLTEHSKRKIKQYYVSFFDTQLPTALQAQSQ